MRSFRRSRIVGSEIGFELYISPACRFANSRRSVSLLHVDSSFARAMPSSPRQALALGPTSQ